MTGLVGRTSGGLHVEHLRACALLEWSITRVRLGLSPDIGLLLVHRATESRELASTSLGVEPHASVDLVQFLDDTRPPGALDAGLRGGVDWLLESEPTTLLGGGTAGIGAQVRALCSVIACRACPAAPRSAGERWPRTELLHRVAALAVPVSTVRLP